MSFWTLRSIFTQIAGVLKKVGAQVGAAFYLPVPWNDFPDRVVTYAITNRHVIERGSAVVRFNMIEGGTNVLDSTGLNWLLHPEGDDLAIMPVRLDHSVIRAKAIGVDQFITPSIIDEHKIGPGDEVFMVGRFIDAEGRQRNTPSVRFGNIARMNIDPYVIERTSGDFEQEYFWWRHDRYPDTAARPLWFKFLH
jgi:hypothetical protein